jgi:hypothetical protein
MSTPRSTTGTTIPIRFASGTLGNLLDDGTNTYTYDAANRLTSFTNGTTTSNYPYRCNGMSRDQGSGIGCESDRASQTMNGVTTNYVLDLNAGLTPICMGMGELGN